MPDRDRPEFDCAAVAELAQDIFGAVRRHYQRRPAGADSEGEALDALALVVAHQITGAEGPARERFEETLDESIVAECQQQSGRAGHA